MVSVTSEVNNDVAKNAELLKSAITEGIIQAATFIVDLAVQLAPEDSGDLKRSGRVIPGDFSAEVSFGDGLPDDRALAQEYGTIYMPAQPYLGPAIKEIDVLEEVAKAVRRVFT